MMPVGERPVAVLAGTAPEGGGPRPDSVTCTHHATMQPQAGQGAGVPGVCSGAGGPERSLPSPCPVHSGHRGSREGSPTLSRRPQAASQESVGLGSPGRRAGALQPGASHLPSLGLGLHTCNRGWQFQKPSAGSLECSSGWRCPRRCSVRGALCTTEAWVPGRPAAPLPAPRPQGENLLLRAQHRAHWLLLGGHRELFLRAGVRRWAGEGPGGAGESAMPCSVQVPPPRLPLARSL